MCPAREGGGEQVPGAATAPRGPLAAEETLELFVKCVGNQTGPNAWAPPNDTVGLRCPLAWTVGQLKNQLHVEIGLAPGNQRLVFKRKALVDSHTLRFYAIAEADTLFLLRTAAPGAAPPGAPAQREAPGLDLGAMLDVPGIEALFQDSSIIEAILDAHPQFRELRERVPELNSVLSDPEMIRQSIEAMRNPAMMREMMRHTDRALSNIDTAPGGHDALRRMYQTIQEPLMGAMGPPETLATSAAPPNLGTEGPPRRDAVPNPWGAPPDPAHPARAPAAPHPTPPRPPVAPVAPVAPVGAAPAPQLNYSVFANLMNQRGQDGLAPPAEQPSSGRDRYRQQVATLGAMGFRDEAAVVRALEACNGNLNGALDRLLGGAGLAP